MFDVHFQNIEHPTLNVEKKNSSRCGDVSGINGPRVGAVMSNPFGAFCEDFYINMRLGSQMNLPHARETVLHLFETVRKQFPGMTRFRKCENGEINLEEDREHESYRWASLEQR